MGISPESYVKAGRRLKTSFVIKGLKGGTSGTRTPASLAHHVIAQNSNSKKFRKIQHKFVNDAIRLIMPELFPTLGKVFPSLHHLLQTFAAPSSWCWSTQQYSSDLLLHVHTMHLPSTCMWPIFFNNTNDCINTCWWSCLAIIPGGISWLTIGLVQFMVCQKLTFS